MVQHGASTLPNDLFGEFPKHKTLEIHLATGLQNIVFDNLPQNLKDEIYGWLNNNHQAEWNKALSHEQNIYKTRKKALANFKSKLWNLSIPEKQPILKNLEKELEIIFQKLNIVETREVLEKYI